MVDLGHTPPSQPRITGPEFKTLNDGWNADPVAANMKVHVSRDRVALSFLLDPWTNKALIGEVGRLTFNDCVRWRLGPPGEEGWRRGEGRYRHVAPDWGMFYEIVGDDTVIDLLSDWHPLNPRSAATRYFLFYLKEATFECVAEDWSFSRSGVP